MEQAWGQFAIGSVLLTVPDWWLFRARSNCRELAHIWCTKPLAPFKIARETVVARGEGATTYGADLLNGW